MNVAWLIQIKKKRNVNIGRKRGGEERRAPWNLRLGGCESRGSEYETHFLLYWLKSNSIKEIHGLNHLNKMNNAFLVLLDSDKPYITHGEEAVTASAAAQCVSKLIKYENVYNLLIWISLSYLSVTPRHLFFWFSCFWFVYIICGDFPILWVTIPS